ncbi:MAG TPA: redoxin domain-containing protein [Pyrinomonadaceae bacterium]|nr:redoxin domain-containing protein [Pyrinomonadaceae bacterium]
MKKLGFLAAAIFAIVAIVAGTAFVYFNNAKWNEDTNAYADLAVGATVDNFSLVDTNGAEKSFNDLKGKNGAILVFVSAQCPVVKQYNERISGFAADFAAKGINVIGINSNHTESPEWVKSHAAEKYKFPVLIDKGNVLADKLGAEVTPETFYVNEKNVLIYHGAIDNSRSGGDITENYLRDAVEANLSGKPVARKNANAFGCNIKRV